MEEREIIARLKNGDESAMTPFLTKYGPLLRYIIASILENPLDREECFSDAAMRVWEKIGLFEPERGSFRSFCSAIARSTALNARKKIQSAAADALDESREIPNASPDDLLNAFERRDAILNAVSRLSRAQQALFYRKYYYEQSTAQIARELGMTERAVEGKLYRMREKLRKTIGGDLDG